MSKAKFITFEGGEGSGKSTQIRLLAKRLERLGGEVVVTREPGGSAGAEALRSLLVRGSADRWSPLSETLILYAARSDHIARTIEPALARGAWVLSDRFADSTRAYQGAAGGVDPVFIAVLEDRVVGPIRPTITLILDLAAEDGLRRAAMRGEGETRFEDKGLAFHLALREAYRRIADAEPGRCSLVNAAQSIEQVEDAIWRVVAARFGLGAV